MSSRVFRTAAPAPRSLSSDPETIGRISSICGGYVTAGEVDAWPAHPLSTQRVELSALNPKGTGVPEAARTLLDETLIFTREVGIHDSS